MRNYAKAMLAILFSLSIVSCENKNLTEADNKVTAVETFITYDDLFKNAGPNGPDRVQDFDLNSSTVFLHPTGAFGIYQYQLDSGELKKLVDYPSGNYIAHESEYLFYEVSGVRLHRYNLASQSTDLQFDLTSFDFSSINGLDCDQGRLYLNLYSQNSKSAVLAVFDFDGNFVESISYPRNTLHLTIDNDVAYAIFIDDTATAELSRFSLSTKSFLENQSLPTENWDGIRTFKDKLYFADFERHLIGAIAASNAK